MFQMAHNFMNMRKKSSTSFWGYLRDVDVAFATIEAEPLAPEDRIFVHLLRFTYHKTTIHHDSSCTRGEFIKSAAKYIGNNIIEEKEKEAKRKLEEQPVKIDEFFPPEEDNEKKKMMQETARKKEIKNVESLLEMDNEME